jgi:hypothetical protein
MPLVGKSRLAQAVQMKFEAAGRLKQRENNTMQELRRLRDEAERLLADPTLVPSLLRIPDQ